MRGAVAMHFRILALRKIEETVILKNKSKMSFFSNDSRVVVKL